MQMENLCNREAVAVHEAGHAVAAHVLGLPLGAITLRSSDSATGGCVEMDKQGAWPALEEMVPRGIAALAAGRLAEHLAGVPTEGGGPDEDKLVQLTALDFERRLPQNLRDSSAVARARVDAVRTLVRGSALAELVLRAEWGAVRKLASWLLRGPYLRADQAIACIEAAPIAPLLCTEEHLRQLGEYAGNDAAGFAESQSFVELVTRVTRAKYEAEFDALLAEHEAGLAARAAARLAAPPWERKRATYSRPAAIPPAAPSAPAHPVDAAVLPGCGVSGADRGRTAPRRSATAKGAAA